MFELLRAVIRNILSRTSVVALLGFTGFGAGAACDTSPETHWPDLEGGVPTFAACHMPGQCVALVSGCCGTCGAPTLKDVVGVNADDEAAFRAATCTSDAPVCPECVQTAEPNLVALCENTRCTPVDIRLDPFSACTQDEDCALRYAECCESCSEQPSSVIAIATKNLRLYADEICQRGKSCPSCAPVYPASWSAACGQDGHCKVVATTTP